MIQLTGWRGVGRLFEFTIPEQLDDSIEQAIDQAEKTYSEAVAGLIAEQPSNWVPKSREWALRSGSSSLFIGKTGQFASAVTTPGQNSQGMRAKYGNRKIFVGARPTVRHHSGLAMSQIAGILQNKYGSRDLFDQAYRRVDDIIEGHFRKVGHNLGVR